MKKKVLAIIICLSLCLSLIPMTVSAGSGEAKIGDVEYTTLADAFAAAVDGDTIVLTQNVDYTASTPIAITGKTVTLDCSDYTLTSKEYSTSLFSIASDGGLILGGGKIVVSYGNNSALVKNNYGTLVVKDVDFTNAKGYFVEDNYGSIVLNGGTLAAKNIVCGLEKNGSFVMDGETVDITCDSYLIETIALGGTAEINSGKVTANSRGIGTVNGEATFNGGSIDAKSFVVDQNRNKLTFNGGEYHSGNLLIQSNYAELTINGGTFVSDGGGIFISGFEGTATMTGGSIKTVYDAFTVQRGRTLTVTGGTVIGGAGETDDYSDGDIYNAIYVDDGTATLSGGIFESVLGTGAFYEGDGEIIIAANYEAIPSDWRETKASHVEIIPEEIQVNFYSEGNLVDAYKGLRSDFEFPEDPIHSSGYNFCLWVNEDGNVVKAVADVKKNDNIYAVFDDVTYNVRFEAEDGSEISTVQVTPGTVLGTVDGMDRKDEGEYMPDKAFLFWTLDGEQVDENSEVQVTSDIVIREFLCDNIVFNMDELEDAINAHFPYIVLGADITVDDVIDSSYTYDLTISGFYNGEQHSLIRDEDYVDDDLLYFHDSSANLTLMDMTIDGSNAMADYAAVYATCSTLTLDGVTFKNNCTDYYGGALYSYLDNLTIKNCEFTENNSNYGGAIYDASTKTTIDNTSFTNNSANYGGAIYFNDDAASLTDCVISENTANFGGGIYIENHAEVTLNGSTEITGNSAKEGGGVNSTLDVILTMNDQSRISDNNATSNGGGIYMDEQDLIINDDAEISGNKAGGNGGGVYFSSSMFLQNAGVIRDNEAAGKGGGVYCHYGNNTFDGGMMFDNLAEEGGDDLYKEYGGNNLYVNQPARYYNDGRSQELQTVMLQQINGYHEAPIDGSISVPWLGWFEDDEGDRFEDIENSDLIKDVYNVYFEDNTTAWGGAKAIWNGYLLAYDANLDDDQYQFDETAYAYEESADIKDFMFEAPDGKTFIGWNTKADGSGTAYAAGDSIIMTESTVLYAQYDNNIPYYVHYQWDGDIPEGEICPEDTNEYIWHSFPPVDETYTKDTKIDGEQNGVQGVFTFSGWTADDALTAEGMEGDVTFSGTWTFTANPIPAPDPVPTPIPDTVPTPTPTPTPAPDPIPNTGDHSNIAGWFAVMTTALLLAGSLTAAEKKKHNK